MRATNIGLWRVGTALLLSAWMLVASADPLPEFYGFYALDDGRLSEIRPSTGTIDLNFSPNVRFIVFQKTLATATSELIASRMIFVRKYIKSGSDIQEREVNTWQVDSGPGRNVEYRSKPVAGQSEMVMFVAREPLGSGAYVVRYGDEVIGTFFIDKNSVNENLFSSADCVDIVHKVPVEGALLSSDWYRDAVAGRHISQRPCTQETETAASAAVSSTAVQSFEDCVAAGQSESRCARMHADAPRPKDDDTMTRPEAVTLEDDLSPQIEELQRRVQQPPKDPDRTFTDKKAGVSFAYPASFEVTAGKPPVFAWIRVPGDARPLTEQTQFMVSCDRSDGDLIGATARTVTSLRLSLTNVKIDGPVDATVAGVPAKLILATGYNDGILTQKAVAVAVSGDNLLGVMLHARHDAFDDAWDGYRRMLESYTVKKCR